MAEPGEDIVQALEEPVPAVGVTDEERGLASDAHVKFESKQFDESLSALDKLAEMRPKDGKVHHNRCVTQFYQSNCTKTDEFKKNLQAVRKQFEREANESGEEVDDMDSAYLLYNEAVLHYHLKQYGRAITILDRLFKIVEPLDENLACKICFLLIEVYLLVYKAEKAYVVLNYLGNRLCSSNKTVESATQSQAQQQTPAIQQQNQLAQPKEIDESLKLQLHQYKARMNIQFKAMKACKREIKTVLNTNNMTPEGLFLKSNFEYVRQNYRKSIKLLNSSPKPPNVNEHGESISTMFFNNLGCIHYQMNKFNVAAFYFRRALEENDKALATLPQVDKNASLSGRPLKTLAVNRRNEILYNLGVQLLFSGRALAAFDCLVEALQTYHTNPRMWLRLAECCVVAHELSDDFPQQCIKKSDVVQSVVGSGPHRKIVISPPTEKQPVKDQNSQGQSAAMPACTLEFASICLQNSLLLLKSAEMATPAEQDSLVEKQDNRVEEHEPPDAEPSDSNGVPGRGATLQEACVAAPPGPPVRLGELPHLRCAILACSAYVALALGDNVMALSHAQKLSSQPNPQGSLEFLGHLYAAEALIKLNRLPEAIMHLSPERVTTLSFKQPVSDPVEGEKVEARKPHSCEKLSFPQSVQEGRAIMLINLAGTFCLRQEFDKGSKCLQQARSAGCSRDLSAHLALLEVYIELQSGNTAKALQLIKKHQTVLSNRAGVVKPIKKSNPADLWKT